MSDTIYKFELLPNAKISTKKFNMTSPTEKLLKEHFTSEKFYFYLNESDKTIYPLNKDCIDKPIISNLSENETHIAIFTFDDNMINFLLKCKQIISEHIDKQEEAVKKQKDAINHLKNTIMSIENIMETETNKCLYHFKRDTHGVITSKPVFIINETEYIYELTNGDKIPKNYVNNKLIGNDITKIGVIIPNANYDMYCSKNDINIFIETINNRIKSMINELSNKITLLRNDQTALNSLKERTVDEKET